MAGISAISEQVNITLIKLQESNLLISQQILISNLVGNLVVQVVDHQYPW